MHKRLFYIAVLLIALYLPASATHIVGGELNYRCLGNDQYEITLTVYRDCYNGIPWFDTVASVGFFVDTSDVAQFQLLMDSTSSDTLDVILSDPCLSVPPDLCVEVMQYMDTITLPYYPNGYTLVYQRCCRNKIILNIKDPEDTGASFVTHMTGESMLQCNSSPRFKDWPPLALCVNQPLVYDHSATDAEGDSIVYSMCAPYIGATPGNPIPHPPFKPIDQPVTWIDPPYNVSNMLGGVPLTIDAHTGLLTAVPNTIGHFVVGVCMQEYRNGILLSETKRDFQFNVSDCGQVVSSFFSPETQCDDLTVQFVNSSNLANYYHWDFGVPGTNTDTSIAANPDFTYPDTGSYQVQLIAFKDTACTDTFTQTIHLIHSTFEPAVNWQVLACGDSLEVNVLDATTDSVFDIVSWEWTLTNDLGSILSTDTNPHFTLPAAPNTRLTATLTSSDGCTKTDTLDFPYDIVPALPQLDYTVCAGDDLTLNEDGPDNLRYAWHPGMLLDDSLAAHPELYDIQQTLHFTADVIGADSVCMRHFDVNVHVSDVSISAQAEPDTIFKGQTAELSVWGVVGGSLLWSPDKSLSGSQEVNPTASPEETTLYQVIYTNTDGCADTASVRVVVLNPECNLPNLFVPSAFTPNGDGLNDVFKVYGYTIASGRMMVYDRWGERVFTTRDLSTGWDGTFRGQPLPPDVYGYYVEVTCFNGETFISKGNVTLLR